MSEKPSLEQQIEMLRAEKSALRQENYMLRQTVQHLSNGKWEDALSYGHPYLMAKIQRQRWAINAIQWRGWQPEFVIQEEDWHAKTH